MTQRTEEGAPIIIAPFSEEVELWAGPMDGRVWASGGAGTIIFPYTPSKFDLCSEPLPCEHRYDGKTGQYQGRFRPGGIVTI